MSYSAISSRRGPRSSPRAGKKGEAPAHGEGQIGRKVEIGNHSVVDWPFRNIGDIIRNAGILAVAGDTHSCQNNISTANRHKPCERLG